jgi:hypothetical protein
MEVLNNMSTFRADEEFENSNKLTQDVSCIADLKKMCDPSSPNLTEEETKQVKREICNNQFLLMQYPRRSKFRVDPDLPGQNYALISFIPSKDAKPDAEGCFGVVKVRGTFSTVADAEKWAENIIRHYDSYSDIDFVRVGHDFPMMIDNSIFVSSTREIDVRKKVEETVKEGIKKKKEEDKKAMEEIQERQERLLNNKEEKTDIEDLDYYTQLRVKKANAQHMMDECRKRIGECQDVIEATNNQIHDLDTKFPSYKEEFVAKYRHALESIGSDAKQNPLIKYMEEDSKEDNNVTTTEATENVQTSNSSEVVEEKELA